METTCLTDPKWRRMDGAVPPDPAAPEMFVEKPTESPRALGWLREHGLTLGGSVLFVGGLLWLLHAGALPVVPPAEAWSGVRAWAVFAYVPLFLLVHALRCGRWALLIPAAAGAAAAGGASPSPSLPQPMACEIRISDTASGWAVEPVALSGLSVAGEYEFTVSKVSKSGTAVSSQSGDFETLPGEPTVLGSAVFDRKGRIAAELTVRWSGGAVSCERHYPGA